MELGFFNRHALLTAKAAGTALVITGCGGVTKDVDPGIKHEQTRPVRIYEYPDDITEQNRIKTNLKIAKVACAYYGGEDDDGKVYAEPFIFEVKLRSGETGYVHAKEHLQVKEAVPQCDVIAKHVVVNGMPRKLTFDPNGLGKTYVVPSQKDFVQ